MIWASKNAIRTYGGYSSRSGKGSEFLNHMLAGFLAQDNPDCLLSRSRCSTPNDNRVVEQKNSSLIRHNLGDRRLDSVAQTDAPNAL